MHLKNPLLFGLMAILLLGGTITPAISQSSPEFGIVINEVELNPKGSDAGYGTGGSGINSKTTTGLSGAQEYVELYNTSDETIDISGWSIVPSATWKSLVIPGNTLIEPNSFLAFTYVNFWFKDFGETVTLVDNMGNVIDETPLLKDNDDESTTWQRATDGLDTDSTSDWELKRMTPKSSNGKIITEESTSFSLTASIDNSEFTFGQTATISGSISEKLFTVNSTPEIVKITVKGPSYFKNIALFPDRDLNFSTTLNIQKVLGFNQGDYSIDVSYGEHIANVGFSLVTESELETSDSITEQLSLSTDKESYIPGEFVIFFADTNSEIEFGGLDYTVTNPNGETVFEGTIFPNSEFSTVFQHGAGQIYPFSTKFFMAAVNPVYGTYEINGTFKSQDTRATSTNTIEASTTFILAEDVKEDVSISISTDKEIYAVGDIIKVTGRSNDVWVEDLEVQVIQTGVLSANAVGSDSRYVAPDPFELRDRVRLNGDGTFEFEFKVVESSGATENYSKRYGDYKISVSEYFGDGVTTFKVVNDPESFVDIRTPLGLQTDKSEYALGTGLRITGKVLDYHQSEVSNNMRNSIEISFSDSSGEKIKYYDHGQKEGYQNCNTNDCEKYLKPLVYYAYPDLVGGFSMNVVLTPLQFDYGVYTINAKHPLSGISESVQFEVKSAQSDIIPETETQEPLTLQICKSNRAHVDEILKDLRTIGKGELEPSMESVDCNDNKTFSVGDKLVVTGKVIPKTGVVLDQSSTKTSGQTQQGSSYATNYAQAMMNYVEVSIPYPRTMAVTSSAAWVTTPDEGENYTGGGGTGAGGAYYEDKDGNIIRGDEDKKTSRTDDAKRTGYDGTAVLKKQKLLLTDMNYKAYPDKEGNFATVFELRAGVFSSGVYAVKANYFGYNEETSVRIVDNSLKGGLSPNVVLNIQKDEFVPGETVRINGQIENVYYYDNVSVKIETPDISQINCFQGQQCGSANSERNLRVQEGVNGPTFFMNYKIPNSSSSVGTHTIVVDTHFGEFEKQFVVIEETEVIGIPTSSSITKIIDKFNRISDNEIPITLDEKSSEESTLMPRVLQGSLFTSARGEESDVNLRVSTSDGQCIIGQDSTCLVSESTRKPGEIYSIVSIDDVNYKIRYSGNDVRLEKFSIVPEESNSSINVDNWKVEVIKDEQPTRFYYKVSYIALE